MRKNNQTGHILPKWGADKKVNNFLWRTVQMCRYFLTTCTNKLHEDKNIKQMSCSPQEIGRSLLPMCSSDAKIFSSDVYKKSTQARKYQADGLQYGRSMVEMLGVLAIIGVLSVGAIAGYQKAMFKYKLNKHAESFNLLLNNALQYTSQMEGYTDNGNTLEHYAPFFFKANLIPDGMRYMEDIYIYDQFNNQMWIYKYSNNPFRSMGIRLENNQRGLHICSNIINIVKENSDNLYYITNQNYDSAGTDTYSERLYGNKYCKKDNLCLSKLTLVDIENTCNFCKEKNCTLYIHWY